MKNDIFKKLMLSVIALLLLLNFFQGGILAQTAEADKNGEAGRYQISAWASPAGARSHHSGYYIVDTVTGKVVDKKSEVHSLTE